MSRFNDEDGEPRRCKYCRGTGREYVERGSSLSYECPDCGGTGYEQSKDEIETELEGEEE